jgi:hypothetical protein
MKILLNIFLIFLVKISAAQTITLTTTTADNGLPARSITWNDANNLQRNAILVDQRIAGAGYLRRFTYKVAGVDRVCRGTGANGHQGDGYVQNHTAYGGDNSSHGTAGTTSIPLNGAHHTIIEFDLPNYYINPSGSGGTNGTVPTKVQWFFATGRDYPIYSLMQDARGITAGNLGADSRSPYGDMHYDGNTNYSSPYSGDLIGGASWGDTHKWVTLTNATLNESTQATTNSGWRYDEPNSIPYAMQWTKNVNAEFGRVLTQSISVKDMGLNSYPALANVQTPNGPLISDGQWCYQILNYGIVDAIGGVTKRLTWGTNFGYPGGFDEYGNTSLSKTDFTKHSNGVRTNGMLLGYSVFDIFGTHTGGYKNGATGKMVKQMENMQLATLTATIGTVKTSGPLGVGLVSNAANNVTYVPAGYNHLYATWESNAASNIVDVTLTPAAAAPIEKPVFVVNNFTAATINAVCINGVAGIANIDYFATVDAANSKAWITLNSTITNPTTVRVNAGTCGVVASNNLQLIAKNNLAGNSLRWDLKDNEVIYFEVEKSFDGVNFFKLAKINLDFVQEYIYFDSNPEKDICYYRITAVKNNGSFTYSNIVKLMSKQNSIQILQEMAINKINITSTKATTGIILLYDMQGKLIDKTSFTKNTIFTLNHVAKGTYNIEVICGNEKVNKMVTRF